MSAPNKRKNENVRITKYHIINEPYQKGILTL